MHEPGQHTAQHFPRSCPRGAGSPWSRDQHSPIPAPTTRLPQELSGFSSSPFSSTSSTSQGPALQIPPHALAPETLVQDGPTRMLCPYGLPANSGAGNHTRPLALASAPAVPHCQAPLQFLAHCFEEEQHPIHAFHSRVLRSWPWIHLDSFPPCAAVATALLRTCRTRDTGVSCASPSHVAQAVQR